MAALNAQHQAELERIFMIMDTSHDGRVDRLEIQAMMTRLNGGSPVPIGRIDMLMRNIDTDGDGQIDFTEFKSMVLRALQSPAAAGGAAAGAPPSPTRAARATSFHGDVRDIIFGGGGSSALRPPDLLRQASSRAVEALKTERSNTDDASRMEHAEIWSFIGGDGPLSAHLQAEYGIDIGDQDVLGAEEVLKKLTAAINYFTPGMPNYGAGQAVAVVTTILVGGVPAAIEAKLKELVKHIGVVALFTSPHQRFAAKDRLLHLFNLAHVHHLGGLLSQVIHITRQYRNFGGGVGSVAEMETIGQVASLGIFFYLGAFTSYSESL